MTTDLCDYCGTPGCHWRRHPQAVADVRARQDEVRREEFPFGDYQEQPL